MVEMSKYLISTLYTFYIYNSQHIFSIFLILLFQFLIHVFLPLCPSTSRSPGLSEATTTLNRVCSLLKQRQLLGDATAQWPRPAAVILGGRAPWSHAADAAPSRQPQRQRAAHPLRLLAVDRGGRPRQRQQLCGPARRGQVVVQRLLLLWPHRGRCWRAAVPPPLRRRLRVRSGGEGHPAV